MKPETNKRIAESLRDVIKQAVLEALDDLDSIVDEAVAETVAELAMEAHARQSDDEEMREKSEEES